MPYKRSPTYISWESMKRRCRDNAVECYPRYGGRGITICAEWSSFKAFLRDMGPRPAGTSLDRIDNNGNYEPGNCRWATIEEQGRNKRNNRYATLNGETMLVSDWAKRLGMHYTGVILRLKNWPIEHALTLPPKASVSLEKRLKSDKSRGGSRKAKD